MFLEYPFRETSIYVVVPKSTERRLAPLHFRGSQCQRAGNFRTWRHPLDVFRHSLVKEQFLAELDAMTHEEYYTPQSVAIELGEVIGWESTDRHDLYPEDALEVFRPGNGNRERSALRIRLERTEFQAPASKTITIVFTFGWDKNHKNCYKAIIHSLYPGEDIGPLEGDITEREKRVFFDWNHPGAPI